MSAKEMENLDEQVLQVANSAGIDRDAYEAEKAERETERLAKVCVDKAAEDEKRQKERYIAQQKTRRLLTMLARVAACLVAACVFLALILEPVFWVPVVGCLGIMTFVVVGAICIDRHVQNMKRWR